MLEAPDHQGTIKCKVYIVTCQWNWKYRPNSLKQKPLTAKYAKVAKKGKIEVRTLLIGRLLLPNCPITNYIFPLGFSGSTGFGSGL
jgi:hypothetical protein